MIPFTPDLSTPPKLLTDIPTGWGPCEQAIASIIERFNVKRHLMLEFGVEYGFSTAAFSNFFDIVIGVDHFKGDEHSGGKEEFGPTFQRLLPFRNITLDRCDYKDWISRVTYPHFDLIHIDIVHTFVDTFVLGDWAVNHAPVVLFHDTLSFSGVMAACEAIAKKSGKEFYNWNCINGLGVIA